MSEEKKRDVGYLFALAYNMGTDASLTLSGNFNVGATKEYMSAELDKCYAVLERQRAKAKIPGLKAKLELEKRQFEQNQKAINEMTLAVQNAGKNDPGKGSNANALKTLLSNEEIHKGNIELAQMELSHCEDLAKD